jgi:membrane peptidoglycan carboxypeptidase
MTKSINTVYYRLAVDVGPRAVATAAHAAGIPADLLPNPTAGIALGDKEVHPGDMASAYATFADRGIYHSPHLVSRVTTADGRMLYQAPSGDGEQRFAQQVARNVTESMINVAGSSLIPLSGDRPVAAKTGTTQHRIEGQNKDAWTVGYTPTLSTAVWVGADDNSAIETSGGRPMYGPDGARNHLAEVHELRSGGPAGPALHTFRAAGHRTARRGLRAGQRPPGRRRRRSSSK